MTPERWEQVSRMYQSVLEQAPATRGAFLAEACRDDSALRREVESLLAREHAPVLVDQPVDVAAAAVLADAHGLPPGSFVGPYRVTALIGKGGMGHVYRAHDTKLQRDVALKILPDAFVHDHDRVARFTREAHVLASLNHPNIGAIYGFEDSGDVHALVLELIEGPTLADRIDRGALPVDEALAIARQIAEALEAAHENGIVHRDLKPANIKVREDGTVKVLDFGLAKPADVGQVVASRPAGIAGSTNQDPAYTRVGAPLTQSPTIMSPAVTRMGVILGTAAYMSPEQAKGKPADKRSDIWAFGCVLFEMLTGKRAFDGEDVSDTLAAVLRAEPDWRALPSRVPPSVATLLKRCLEKDRRRRIGDIAAAQFVLADQIEIGGSKSRTAHQLVTRSSGMRFPLFVAVILTAALTTTAAWFLSPRSGPPPPVVQFTFTLGPNEVLSGSSRWMVAISPDGRRIVYTANNRLFLRPIGDSVAHVITGTESDGAVTAPVFSPDGRWMAYHRSSASDNAIRRIPVDGGVPTTVVRTDSLSGMSWGEHGIVYAAGGAGEAGIFRILPNGGPPEQLVRLDDEHRAWGPQLLPGGALLFTLVNSPRGRPLIEYDDAQIVVQSLTTGERTTLVENASDARYLPSGHLIFAVSGSLFAVRFDPATRKIAGDQVPILAGVRRGSLIGVAQFAVSDTGTLVYIPGPVDARAATHVVSVSDRRGTATTLKLTPGSYARPRVSPDGTRLAVAIDEGDDTDIAIYDLAETSAIRRLTIEGRNRHPAWSHDGQRVAFQSNRQGDEGIFWQRADGQGAVDRLTTAAKDVAHVPESFSPDGKYLLFSEQKGRTHTVNVLSLVGKTIASFGSVTSSTPPEAVFSPDGRWVAYASTRQGDGLYSPESGTFIQAFPATGAIFQVPKMRIDYHPAWAPDGKSLFYISAAPRPITVVEVRTEPSVSFGVPVELPASVPRPAVLNGNRRGYDVLPDGRILTVSPAREQDATEGPLQRDVRVVVNWFEELKRLLPPQ